VNLLLLLEMAGAGDPDRVAFRGDGEEMTVAVLRRRALGVGAALAARGSSTLVYGGTNGLAFPVAVFGAAAAGIPLVPVNYRLSRDRREEILTHHPGALVVADQAQLASLAERGHDAIGTDDLLTLGETVATDTVDPDPDTVAVLLYTSGTTSDPKAVVLRHRHLTSYVLSTVEYGSAAAADAALVAVPPYHVAGVAHVLTNLYAGRRVVYLDTFDAAVWLDLVRGQGVTHAMVVPTMLARIVDRLEADGVPPPPTLASIVYGGAAMPARVLERALLLFPDVDFVNAYGLTETASTIALLGPDDHRRALDDPDPAVRERLRSAGRVVPGVEVEIRGPDGRVGDANHPGGIYVRGPQVSGEYLGEDGPSDPDGWFATRDNGYVDADGYLFVTGRDDDTIIKGGENIAPAEIETVITTHPGVADAAVVGVEDDEWGQRIVAVVVPVDGSGPTAEEIREWVRERLRGSRTPDAVAFRDALPYTETGKLLRRSLRADLQDRPGQPGAG
jgi:acyl-CoA synthetase (AMP-forming)/AMP-acid ligase II